MTGATLKRTNMHTVWDAHRSDGGRESPRRALQRPAPSAIPLPSHDLLLGHLP